MGRIVRSASKLAVVLALSACSAAPSALPPSDTAPTGGAIASTAPTVAEDPWAEDLAALDQLVRTAHPSPWAIHPESEWKAALARVGAALPTASANAQISLVAQLMGLLDTHSCICGIPGGWHFYGLVPYRFADGFFVVNAADPGLIGRRLVSIGGLPMDDVVERVTPIIPHDNESGLLGGLQWALPTVEFLNGTGTVADTAHPAFELEGSDGTRTTVDPTILDERSFTLTSPGYLTVPAGKGPEAVARRGERIWTRLDAKRRVLLISVNDYGDMTDAIATLASLLEHKSIDRVVVDMRYLQGGSGDIALINSFIGDQRFTKPGALTVLIGRENFSAGTDVAEAFDQETGALLVGEPTPARADNFRCECRDLTLPNSKFLVSVPTSWERNGDERPQVDPDVPMSLSAADFFAGRDPVLDAALKGLTVP
jgi:hypothetical protein